MDIYSEIIVDHYENPQNWGTLEKPDIVMSGNNPLCGDVVNLKAVVANGVITDFKFVAQGCAISIASTSLLSEEVKGKRVEEIKKLEKEAIIKLLGIKLGPSRLKCALLSLDALKEGISKYEQI